MFSLLELFYLRNVRNDNFTKKMVGLLWRKNKTTKAKFVYFLNQNAKWYQRVTVTVHYQVMH